MMRKGSASDALKGNWVSFEVWVIGLRLGILALQ